MNGYCPVIWFRHDGKYILEHSMIRESSRFAINYSKLKPLISLLVAPHVKKQANDKALQVGFPKPRKILTPAGSGSPDFFSSGSGSGFGVEFF